MPLVLAMLVLPAGALAQTAPGSDAAPAPPASADPPAPEVQGSPARRAGAAVSGDPSSMPEERPAGRDGPARPAPADLLDRVSRMVSLRGYLRVRPELQNDFTLGWDNPALGVAYGNGRLPWTRPLRTDDLSGLCAAQTIGGAARDAIDCTSGSQTMANMRLRLNPEIHITDGISVHAQFDVFDNHILGSTPQGYYAGTRVGSPWAPITAFSQTQVSPTPQNSLTPGVNVARAWAEVTNTTLGQIRFGRMPSQWGLGLVANAGNGVDSDFQSHADRIMYAARIRSLRMFVAGFYDFASTGATTQSLRYEAGQGQPIDVTPLDDVRQYGLAVGRRVDPAETRQRLARGQVVINGGFYGLYREQDFSGEFAGVDATTGSAESRDQRTIGNATADYARGLIRRDAWALVADGWFQLLHRSFRLELEVAGIFGGVNTQVGNDPGARYLDIRQFGGAAEFEYRLLNNRLQLEFRTGYASGDSDLEGLNFHNGALAPARGGTTNNTLFRFHPDYRVDMILWRQIFRQVSGAYYFRPGVMYAFVNSPRGDRFYGRASAIWSRASSFVQTRGNDADLGIELNAELTYMSNFRNQAAGELPAPGFFASLQYGVLFPMAGLGPRQDELNLDSRYAGFDFSNAQTLRAILGVIF